ncbi:hypothetical protein K439DRAFT_1198815 [Ramaria rubella]|nr:hypothetical protein K439DRAFT_1198815 [Ramaria rubella]
MLSFKFLPFIHFTVTSLTCNVSLATISPHRHRFIPLQCRLCDLCIRLAPFTLEPCLLLMNSFRIPIVYCINYCLVTARTAYILPLCHRTNISDLLHPAALKRLLSRFEI